MERKSNLIIAAHPDDEILGCGGAINKFKKNGTDSFVLILTDGGKGRYSKRLTLRLRKDAVKANVIVGTKELFFANLPNQQLDAIPITKIIEVIERYIEKLDINCIFTHHCGDLNKDHRLAYEATVTAARPLPGQKVKEIYTYFVASSTEWNYLRKSDIFLPNYFLDIKNEINTKLQAFKCYHREIRKYPHPRSIEALKCFSQFWGICAGLEYAEPFRLIRRIR
jgi:LmbE family N-acetylglucosaminyl deacetylase